MTVEIMGQSSHGLRSYMALKLSSLVALGREMKLERVNDFNIFILWIIFLKKIKI
jgi:hypothetical protein